MTIDDFYHGWQDHKLEACTKGILPLGKVHRLEAHGTGYRQDACSTVLRPLWIADLRIGTG